MGYSFTLHAPLDSPNLASGVFLLHCNIHRRSDIKSDFDLIVILYRDHHWLKADFVTHLFDSFEDVCPSAVCPFRYQQPSANVKAFFPLFTHLPYGELFRHHC